VIRRREFITLIGGAAAAWPLAARAQQPERMPVIGFLHSGSPESFAIPVAAFRNGLSESGYAEGHNVVIEFRWTAGQDARLPELATDLVRRRVAVIVAPTTPAAIAAKAATTTVPIVFTMGGDPVALGLVASLARPGGNVTGISFQTAELAAKRLGLLHDLMPGISRVAALVNPNSVLTEAFINDLQAGAVILGLKVDVHSAASNRDIDAAFAKLAPKPGALLISPDALFTSKRAQLTILAARHAIPAIYPLREFADIGGLMSYGPDFANVYRQAGLYAGRVLKGEKPSDLPIQQPTKFELVINLNTARAIGLDVPPTLLARADDVIE
jgi:putative ABC transport system substrate-binding protein